MNSILDTSGNCLVLPQMRPVSSIGEELFSRMEKPSDWRFILKNMSGHMKDPNVYECFFKWFADIDSKTLISEITMKGWENIAADADRAGYSWGMEDMKNLLIKVAYTSELKPDKKFLKFWSAVSILFPKDTSVEEWSSFFSLMAWKSMMPTGRRAESYNIYVVNFLEKLPKVATHGFLEAIGSSEDFKLLHSVLMEQKLSECFNEKISVTTRHKI